MSYTRQNFIQGMTLNASHLIKIEDAILEMETNSKKGNTYVVRKSNPQSGEYSTIREALSQAAENDTIFIYDGIYQEQHLSIPRGATIIGIGSVTIEGYYSPDTSLTDIEKDSTLECGLGATLENLTITAKNLRYSIHADSSPGKSIWNIKKCRFIHYGNQEVYNYYNKRDGIVSACSAWGGGTHGGDRVYCEDCEFISVGRAFSTHNNTGDTFVSLGASTVKLKDCILTSHAIDVDGKSARFAPALFIQSLNCPVECEVVLTNCKVNGSIVYQNSGAQWSNKLKMYNCNACRTIFDTYGSGLKSVGDREQNQLSDTIDYNNFTLMDGMISLINRGTDAIPAGYPIQKANYGGIELCTDINKFYGIAMENIPKQKSGWVQNKGYISRIYLEGVRTLNIQEGKYITIGNEGHFQVTDEETKLLIVDNQNIFII
jgi:hypothetical protein